jgi:hypothetical protein
MVSDPRPQSQDGEWLVLTAAPEVRRSADPSDAYAAAKPSRQLA